VEKQILKTGRRKEAVARVRLLPGTGKIIVNGKEVSKYFGREVNVTKVMQPLAVTSTTNVYDALVKVFGGGETGQAEAIRLGIARALVVTNDKLKPVLRQFGYLTRDSRAVERKKYGQPKARKRFQFSKR
jgi:small subunit ribosomal protein S9